MNYGILLRILCGLGCVAALIILTMENGWKPVLQKSQNMLQRYYQPSQLMEDIGQNKSVPEQPKQGPCSSETTMKGEKWWKFGQSETCPFSKGPLPLPSGPREDCQGLPGKPKRVSHEHTEPR